MRRPKIATKVDAFRRFRPPWRCLAVGASLFGASAVNALEPSEVFAKASPSVVAVYARTAAGAAFQGSGVVLSSTAVATNCHVVGRAAEIQVVVGTSHLFASLLRADQNRDICLLRVKGLASTVATVADARALRAGARVYSIGSPRGLELTISEGLVSGIRPTKFGDVIQTSAAISHGSSGGGLFNAEGALVGFTSFSLKDGQNLNFAIPAAAAQALLVDVEAPATDVSKAALRKEVDSALFAAVNDAAPPRPDFTTVDERLRYLRWLGAATDRLKQRQSELVTRVEFLQTLWYEALRAGLEPALVLGLVEVESDFHKYAINVSGARGYMQVAPSWAATIGDGDVARLFHMQSNLRFGCVIFRYYLDAAHGDPYAALIAYYGQSSGRSVRINDAAGMAFTMAVFKARQGWIFPD